MADEKDKKDDKPKTIIVPIPVPAKPPPWFTYGKKYSGKKETDPEFNKMMSSKWPLVGLKMKTIAKNWAAWCGLACAVTLASVGISYQKNGAAAVNWMKYGTAIEWRAVGIPQGAIVQINHAGKCGSSKGNHVSQANGDCTPEELLKRGATIDLYGGNQANQWKVSTYSVGEICAVRWPREYPQRGRITVSKNCSSKKPGKESTR